MDFFPPAAGDGRCPVVAGHDRERSGMTGEKAGQGGFRAHWGSPPCLGTGFLLPGHVGTFSCARRPAVRQDSPPNPVRPPGPSNRLFFTVSWFTMFSKINWRGWYLVNSGKHCVIISYQKQLRAGLHRGVPRVGVRGPAHVGPCRRGPWAGCAGRGAALKVSPSQAGMPGKRKRPGAPPGGR